MAFNPSGLTDRQQKELKKLLQDRLSSLNTGIRDLELELKKDGSCEGQGASDELDRSSFEEAMQRAQLVLAGKHKTRRELILALKKFDEGLYGICEETEEPIGYQRLRAQPWTRYSLDAQLELEKTSRFVTGLRSTVGTTFPAAMADDS